MPKLEVDKINTAFQKVIADPVVQERLQRVGLEALTTSPEEFAAILRADWENAAAVVKASGAKVE